MKSSDFNAKIEKISMTFPDLLRNLQTFAYQNIPIGETDEEKLCTELSLSQMRTLAVFVSNGGEIKPLKMSDIAKKLNVCLPTVTQIVDKLVSLELLERLKDEEDRRLVIVNITEKGKRLVKLSQDRRRYSIRRWLEKLSVEKQKELVATLEKLIETLEKINKIEQEEKI